MYVHVCMYVYMCVCVCVCVLCVCVCVSVCWGAVCVDNCVLEVYQVLKKKGLQWIKKNIVKAMFFCKLSQQSYSLKYTFRNFSVSLFTKKQQLGGNYKYIAMIWCMQV